MLNNLVDKIFVITTQDSERLEYISNHLNSYNLSYEFFIAPQFEILSKELKIIYGGGIDDRYVLSLLSAYLSIIYSAKYNGLNKIAIIEDDCYFCKDWREKLKKFIDELPKDWQLLNLGYHPIQILNKSKKKISDYVSIPLNGHFTTHCTILKKDCFDIITSTIKKFNYSLPIDCIFCKIYRNENYKTYVPNEEICHQLSVRKDYLYDVPDTQLRFKSYLYE